jgi:anhydro-N-acetylmuramic acid kinase
MNFFNFQKNIFFGIGIMTGTSCDAIDISLVEIHNIVEPVINLISFQSYEFSALYSEKINEIITKESKVKEISQLNYYLSQVFAEYIEQFIKDTGIAKSKIDFVSVHGQTLWHNPKAEMFLDKYVASSFQSLNLSALAKLTGLPVVGDFRSGDIALKGQGAPLVPIFDYYFFKDQDVPIIALNLGGIANLTYLPKNADLADVIAFDCGPANTLLDFYANKFFGQNFDKNGLNARNGKLDNKLLQILLSDEYFELEPPKSTGREKFNHQFIDNALQKLNYKVNELDLMRTLTELTVKSIEISIRKFAKPQSRIIVSGGGSKNVFLMERLKHNLFESEFIGIEQYGITSQSKESVAFAFLGWLFLNEKNGNIPNATGASHSTILGVLAI